jgi:ribosome modulation factor
MATPSNLIVDENRTRKDFPNDYQWNEYLFMLGYKARGDGLSRACPYESHSDRDFWYKGFDEAIADDNNPCRKTLIYR